MKLIGNFKYLGMEKVESKDKKNTWTFAGFLQGLDSEKLFITNDSDIIKLQAIPAGADVSLQLDVKVTKDKTYLSLVDIVPNSEQKNVQNDTKKTA